MPSAVEMLMKAAKTIDDNGSKPAAAPAAPVPAAAKPAPPPAPWLGAYADSLNTASVFATAAFLLTVSVSVGIVYGGLGSILDTSGWLMKIGAMLLALASAAPLVIMWNALEPGSTGWKTVGILVLAALQASAIAGLLYGVIFLVRVL